jgi:hypothetical protein
MLYLNSQTSLKKHVVLKAKGKNRDDGHDDKKEGREEVEMFKI